MSINIKFDVEKHVIDNNAKDNKYTHEEKLKYLIDAIQNDGYYDSNGVWNSIKVFNNDPHIYRVRVETLIIKDGRFIFLKFLPSSQKNHTKRTYLIPGGSISKNNSNINQARNECIEEARIIIKNIHETGIIYKEYVAPPQWAISSQAVNWNGNITEVYVAEYDRRYNGHINKIDEDKFIASGKFYDLNKVFHILRKEHRDAINLIYPNKFNVNTEKTSNDKYINITKEKILNDIIGILIDAGYRPRIAKSDKNNFLYNTTNDTLNRSTLSISGFKKSEETVATSIINNQLSGTGIICTPSNYGTIFISIDNRVITGNIIHHDESYALDDHQFGIPSLRKFPLHDTEHIIQAIRFFNTVDKLHEKELAYNIIKAINMHAISTSVIGANNRLKNYI